VIVRSLGISYEKRTHPRSDFRLCTHRFNTVSASSNHTLVRYRGRMQILDGRRPLHVVLIIIFTKCSTLRLNDWMAPTYKHHNTMRPYCVPSASPVDDPVSSLADFVSSHSNFKPSRLSKATGSAFACSGGTAREARGRY